MREYMITVIGGAVLAAIAHMVAPEKWAKYIKIVTGIMIVSIIISPGAELIGSDIFAEYEYSCEIDENAQKKAVITEMETRIAADVEERILSEYSESITADVVLNINDSYEIEGVEEIKIWNAKNKESIKKRLTEVYAPSKIYFHN